MSLLGKWVLDRSDKRALEELGNVLLEFDGDGRLIYIIREKDRDQIINLRYQVDGSAIVTDQPSSPHIERTEFSLVDDNTLTLAFGGAPYCFIRYSEND